MYPRTWESSIAPTRCSRKYLELRRHLNHARDRPGRPHPDLESARTCSAKCHGIDPHLVLTDCQQPSTYCVLIKRFVGFLLAAPRIHLRAPPPSAFCLLSFHIPASFAVTYRNVLASEPGWRPSPTQEARETERLPKGRRRKPPWSTNPWQCPNFPLDGLPNEG